MIMEKKILLIVPSFVAPKKKAKVPKIMAYFIVSVLASSFLACIPETKGRPL